MISFQTLLLEIEKHTQLAKSTNEEQQIRDQIIAIRTLCEVALAEQNSNIAVTKHHFQGKNDAQTIQLRNTTSVSSNPLKEDDGANGNSIFEF